MTNLNNVLLNWSAPVFLGLLATTAATSGISADASKVNSKTPKSERTTRSYQSASDSDAQTQLSIRGGKMETRVQDGKLVLTGFAGAVGGGQVQLKGNMPVDETSEKTADLRFKDVSVKEAGELIGNPALLGWLGNATLSGTIKGEWQGKGFSNISRTANGSLHVSAGKGEISDPKVLEKLGKVAGIKNLDRLRFNSIQLKAHADDGKVIIDAALVEGPDLNLAMVGNYAVEADNLNLKLAMTVAPELAERSTYLKVKNVFDIFKGDDESAKAENGFVEVPVLLVSGDLKKPEVKLDKSKAVAKAPENTATKVNTAAGKSGFFSQLKELANSPE